MPKWKPWQMPFHPTATGQISDHVYAIKSGNVNLYLYRGADAMVAFDTGLGGQAVQDAFGQLSLGLQDVSAIFLTHSDRDHIGGLELFPETELYLSAQEEPLVTGVTPRMLGRLYGPRLERPRKLLEDGQSVQIADVHVRAVATPGHTTGSMSYLVDGRVLFTGDTLSLRGGWVAPFVRLINMDHATQKASIRKLADLENLEMVCTGHSGYTQAWDQAVAPWRA